MEIRTYLNIILRYWWLLLLAISAGGAGAAVVDRAQKPLYTTQARVTMRPSPIVTDPRDVVNLIGQIGGRYLTGTFAQAFTSAAVRTAARKAVGLTDEQAGAYTLDASVLPDSTVIELRGTGPNPVMLVNYLNATTGATIDNTRDLFRVLDLVPLDTPTLPDTPTSPNPTRDLLGGVGLGLGLGILLTLTYDYLLGLRRAQPQPQPAPAGRLAASQPGPR